MEVWTVIDNKPDIKTIAEVKLRFKLTGTEHTYITQDGLELNGDNIFLTYTGCKEAIERGGE